LFLFKQCHAVLLRHRNYTIPQIAVLLGKRRETYPPMVNRWSVFGLESLKIKAGKGTY